MIGISAFIAVGIIILLILPQSEQKAYFLNTGTGSDSNFTDTTVCSNVGSGKKAVKDSTDGNCEIRTFVGSGDISITNTTDTIIIDFNGTIPSSETTQCINVGSGKVIIQNSTSGNCYVKSLLGGTGITLTNGTTTITITNSGIITASCSNGISCSGTNPLLINGSSLQGQETTVCSSAQSTHNIVKSSTSGNCVFRALVAGTSITITNGTNTITITNSAPEQGCSFAGGTSWWKTESTCLMKGITTSGTDLTLTSNTNDLNLKVTTTDCSATKQFLVGIGPATCGNGFYQLCTNSLASSATSLSCSGFTAKRHLFITWELRVVTSSYTPGIRFNSDSGTNYAWRTSGNGGADTTATSATEIQTGLASNSGGGNIFFCNVYNNQAGDRKLLTCFGANGLDTNAGTLPGRAETAGKWSNTSAQITTVDIIRQAGTGSLNTGSTVTVWGYD
jgi:hypothetical protein